MPCASTQEMAALAGGVLHTFLFPYPEPQLVLARGPVPAQPCVCDAPSDRASGVVRRISHMSRLLVFRICSGL